ncbi:flagellar biosynthetic protein FliO [Lysobacter korlensis]|uniref:Flagellar protein n=1 Tax=Lysobacter korlensis TaxID=553636 RepID=A0ABV6RUR0_9GAMM
MDTVFLALRVIVSLAVVLGVLWYLQKKLSKRGIGRAAGKAVTLIGRQAVGPKASVAVVEIDGRRLVLGVTEHQITVLHSAEAHLTVADPADRALHPFEVSMNEVSAPVYPDNVRPITAPIPIRAVVSTPDTAPDQELRRPRRHRQQPTSRMAGSILSPETWRQASAAIREVR